MAISETDNLIGRTYLNPVEEYGNQIRMKLSEFIDRKTRNLHNNPEMMKFIAENGDGSYEEILTYNQLLDKIENQSDGYDDINYLQSIIGHEGPFSSNDERYKGSKWNVKVIWDNGDDTYDPLGIIAETDPVTCALYSKENGLLHLPGWKRFSGIVKNQTRLTKISKQNNLHEFNHSPTYKYGIKVPSNHNNAMELDRLNGNNKWRDSEN